MLSGVLVLGIVLSIFIVLDLLAADFGADSRPELGPSDHAILN
jgi:hypothetical protein